MIHQVRGGIIVALQLPYEMQGVACKCCRWRRASRLVAVSCMKGDHQLQVASCRRCLDELLEAHRSKVLRFDIQVTSERGPDRRVWN